MIIFADPEAGCAVADPLIPQRIGGWTLRQVSRLVASKRTNNKIFIMGQERSFLTHKFCGGGIFRSVL